MSAITGIEEKENGVFQIHLQQKRKCDAVFFVTANDSFEDRLGKYIDSILPPGKSLGRVYIDWGMTYLPDSVKYQGLYRDIRCQDLVSLWPRDNVLDINKMNPAMSRNAKKQFYLPEKYGEHCTHYVETDHGVHDVLKWPRKLFKLGWCMKNLLWQSHMKNSCCTLWTNQKHGMKGFYPEHWGGLAVFVGSFDVIQRDTRKDWSAVCVRYGEFGHVMNQRRGSLRLNYNGPTFFFAGGAITKQRSQPYSEAMKEWYKARFLSRHAAVDVAVLTVGQQWKPGDECIDGQVVITHEMALGQYDRDYPCAVCCITSDMESYQAMNGLSIAFCFGENDIHGLRRMLCFIVSLFFTMNVLRAVDVDCCNAILLVPPYEKRPPSSLCISMKSTSKLGKMIRSKYDCYSLTYIFVKRF